MPVHVVLGGEMPAEFNGQNTDAGSQHRINSVAITLLIAAFGRFLRAGADGSHSGGIRG